QRIAVSASVMEEVIEGYALSHALEQCTPAAVVICEPSRLRIMVGQKGRQEILLRLQGRPAHAALPHLGVNPIQA
ncbi:YgeY family selenium metabolism-linked hydrolase, partial [Alcaligenes pakistanensis]